LPHTDAEAALTSAERLRTAVEQASWPQQAITISLGVASLTPEIADAATLLSAADQALYTAKAQGRNRTIQAQDMLPSI
jgi:sigma-B regulation protein RsbU (phosphoserine phosphatase)